MKLALGFLIAVSACTVDPPPTATTDEARLYAGYNCTTIFDFSVCIMRLPNGENAYFPTLRMCTISLPSAPIVPVDGDGPALSCECKESLERPGTWINICTGGERQAVEE